MFLPFKFRGLTREFPHRNSVHKRGEARSEMAADCLFCKIVAGQIPAKMAFETERVVAFHDINPQAPTHVLVIPRDHVEDLNALDEANSDVMGEMFLAAKRVAQEAGIAASGYRTVFNCGRDSGMEVNHLHLHVIGGRAMKWPPG